MLVQSRGACPTMRGSENAISPRLSRDQKRIGRGDFSQEESEYFGMAANQDHKREYNTAA